MRLAGLTPTYKNMASKVVVLTDQHNSPACSVTLDQRCNVAGRNYKIPGNALSIQARKNHSLTLPHLALQYSLAAATLPTARLPNTLLKHFDGSGTTGLYDDRRNVKTRYVLPLLMLHLLFFIHKSLYLHPSPSHDNISIPYCCSSTIPSLSVRHSHSLLQQLVDDFKPGNHGQHGTFLFSKQSFCPFCTFDPSPLQYPHQSPFLFPAPAAD